MRISDWSSDVCSSDLDLQPRWVRDLTRFLPLKSQFVLTGNVRDLHIRAIGDRAAAASLTEVLAATLSGAGYADVVRYDPVQGFAAIANRSEERRVGKECVRTGRSRWSTVD